MAIDRKENVEKAICDMKKEQKWCGVKIDKNLLVQAASEDNVHSYLKKPETNKVILLEENVETMVTASFQYIFSQYDLMLVERQRAIMQRADLMAIDKTGRISLFELKNVPVNAEEIIAQATQYLVEFGERPPEVIYRLFDSYHNNFENFQKLYHAAYLVRRRIESQPSLKECLMNLLRKTGDDDQAMEIDKLSAEGGHHYSVLVTKTCEKLILDPRGIEYESAVRRIRETIVGVEPGSKWDFYTLFRKRFQVNPDALNINRRWRLVYFAPQYSFQTQKDGESQPITRYLTEMYLRGMNMHFYEYKLFSLDNDYNWLLIWRETNKWLNSDILSKSSKTINLHNYKITEKAFDEFIYSLAKKGLEIIREPGFYTYPFWYFHDISLAEIEIKYPNIGSLDFSTLNIKIMNPETYFNSKCVLEFLDLIKSRSTAKIVTNVGKKLTIKYKFNTDRENIQIAQDAAEHVSIFVDCYKEILKRNTVVPSASPA